MKKTYQTKLITEPSNKTIKSRKKRCYCFGFLAGEY